MSPTEDQLRAALHHGEGETPDAGNLIARARGLRHTRRMQLAAAAAAVVVVGGIGTGTTLLVRDSGGGGGSSAGSAGQARSAATAGPGAGRQTPVKAPEASVPATAACPAAPPHLMLPGGGGSGQFGATGPLFDGPISSMLVCGYGGAVNVGVPVKLHGSVVLSGAQAQEIADSLNAAPTKGGGMGCADLPVRELVLLAKSRSGKELATVTADLQCERIATNGTAVRYQWNPPSDVAAQLEEITGTRPAIPESGTPHPSGSPLH